ncbi:MAG: prepilin-type N-terminal cleavage/methylation domain-containing protein, partial [Eubacterium sp.]
MQKKWKLNNKGMTLLEVIVAFAIFAVAATILFAGFNGAFKVIQNSNAIKDASQGSAGELEMNKGTVMESAPEFIDATGLETSEPFKIYGKYYAATKKKSNDQTEVSQTMFKADALTPPPIPTVPKSKEAVPVVPTPNLKNPKENDA